MTETHRPLSCSATRRHGGTLPALHLTHAKLMLLRQCDTAVGPLGLLTASAFVWSENKKKKKPPSQPVSRPIRPADETRTVIGGGSVFVVSRSDRSGRRADDENLCSTSLRCLGLGARLSQSELLELTLSQAKAASRARASCSEQENRKMKQCVENNISFCDLTWDNDADGCPSSKVGLRSGLSL